MGFVLSDLSCACAAGRTNAETLRTVLAGSAAGMRALEGELPGRSVVFGAVEGELEEVPEAEYRQRGNSLLLHAVRNSGGAYARLAEKYGPERVAVVLGASNTGVHEAQGHMGEWLETGERPEGMGYSLLELGTPSEYLAKLVGAEGPCRTVSTACSSGAKAFASARRLIACGAADAAVVGGVDAKCRFALNGFDALGALSEGLCSPLTPERDGINLGEGVALFSMERGEGGIELAGCGETSDAYHATAPDPEGKGAELAMRLALEDAGMEPGEIGYLNLHGTGTAANDDMETAAVRRVFGEALPRHESTKRLTGHCLGAAGAVEAAICWLMLESGNAGGAAMSNSFAFGGANASIVLARRGGR